MKPGQLGADDTPAGVDVAGDAARGRFRSVQARLLGPLLVLGLVVGVAGSWLGQRSFEARLVRQVEARARALANAVSFAGEVAQSLPQLERLLERVGAEPDVRHAVLVGGEPPRVIASSDASQVGRSLSEIGAERWITPAREVISRGRILRQDDSWVDYTLSAPVLVPGSGAEGRRAMGAVLVQLDARHLARELSSAAWDVVAGVAVGIALVLLSALHLVRSRVLGPVQRVDQAMQRRRAGDESSYAPVLGQDEFGRLASGINTLIDTLVESRARARASALVGGVGTIVVDEVGHVVSMDAGAERLFRSSGRELAGSSVRKLLPPGRESHADHLRGLLHPDRRAADSGGRTVQGRRRDGSTLELRLSVSEARLAERALHVLALREVRRGAQAAAPARREPLAEPVRPPERETQPVFDRERAVAGRGGDLQLLGETAGVFLSQAERALGEIEAALAEHDVDGVCRAALGLQAAAASFCAQPAMDALGGFAKRARDGGPEAAGLAWPAVRAEVERLSRALAAEGIEIG